MSPPIGQLEQRAQRRVGTVLRGKYALVSVLGAGGMAAVYLGVHRNGHRVAVKVLHPETSADPDTRARFLREGYVANSIGHPGAVRVIDDDEAEDGAAFLVMELLEGETLHARAKRLGGRLPVAEALALGRDLCDVLAAAHAQGVVHRDIKPENLFLTTDRVLKVLDFGIARGRDVPGAMGTEHGLTHGHARRSCRRSRRSATTATSTPAPTCGPWAATLFTLVSGAWVHRGGDGGRLLVFAAHRAGARFAPRGGGARRGRARRRRRRPRVAVRAGEALADGDGAAGRARRRVPGRLRRAEVSGRGGGLGAAAGGEPRLHGGSALRRHTQDAG